MPLGSCPNATIKYMKRVSTTSLLYVNVSVCWKTLCSFLSAGYETPCVGGFWVGPEHTLQASVCGGIVYTVTRCVLCASSMVTVCQCVQYQFSPVARQGQGVMLRNSLRWLMTGMTSGDQDNTTLNYTCWHSQVDTTWCHHNWVTLRKCNVSTCHTLP